MKIKAVGAYSAKQPLEPMDITRRVMLPTY